MKSKVGFIVLFLIIYTWIIFHYTASAVITFQKPYANENGNGIVIELWGQLYDYTF